MLLLRNQMARLSTFLVSYIKWNSYLWTTQRPSFLLNQIISVVQGGAIELVPSSRGHLLQLHVVEGANSIAPTCM